MLYNKHRPKRFEDFYARDAIVTSIKSLLDREKERPKIFMFHGRKGTGKTTLSFLLAKYIGCDERSVYHINFSNQTGIDDARELEEEAKMLPRYGDFKVYICDEIQRLSSAGQDSLLNFFEKPPKHCYFMLCTTNPLKISDTLKDRCYIYELDAFKKDEIFYILKSICKREKKKVPSKVLEYIAEYSSGSARSAIINLDKIIDVPAKELKLSEIQFEKEELALNKLGQALIKQATWKTVASMLREITADPESIRIFIDRYMEACLLNGNSQAAIILGAFEEHKNIALACYDSVT